VNGPYLPNDFPVLPEATVFLLVASINFHVERTIESLLHQTATLIPFGVYPSWLMRIQARSSTLVSCVIFENPAAKKIRKKKRHIMLIYQNEK
jgi:hypothetical protein